MIANDLPYCDEYYLPKKLRKEYYKARKKPAIIHYIGNMMPCFNPYPDMYTYFWKYARQSPCYEIILQRMSMNSAHRYYLSIKQRLELLVQYWPNILLYWRYKILSKITFGKKRKKYKEKRKNLKTLIKQTKQFLKGIK